MTSLSTESASILANIQKLRESKLMPARQIGGRGSMRHKAPKPQKVSNQLQIYEDIIKKFDPAKTPVSNIGGINFFSSENSEQNLQFNFPQVNAIGKAHAIVITGKAVQPDLAKDEKAHINKDDDDIPDMGIPDLVNLSGKDTSEPKANVEVSDEVMSNGTSITTNDVATNVVDVSMDLSGSYPKPDVTKLNTEAVKEEPKEIKETTKEESNTIPGSKPSVGKVKTKRKQNKHEKLLRSLLSKKLKVQELLGIDEVKIQIKKEFFCVEDPYVMKVLIPTKDIYVVFGVIKPWAEESGTITTDTQSLMADFSQDDRAPDLVSGETTEISNADMDETTEEKSVDLIKSDIDIVMGQTSATRDQAIHALNQHNGDIVEAIMSLS